MHLIRKLPFLPNENFAHVSDRYLKYLLKDVSDGSEIIHFCCDRYRDVSLKSEEQSKRTGKQREKWSADEVSNPYFGFRKLYLGGGNIT